MKQLICFLTLILSFQLFASPIRSTLGVYRQESPHSDLPYDAEVEWLQGDGRGTFIDTGISLYDGDIEVLFAFASYKQNGGAFGYTVYGAWKGQKVSGLTVGLACFAYDNTIRLRFSYNNEAVKDFDTETHLIVTKNNRIYFDGLDTGKYAKVTKYNNEVI